MSQIAELGMTVRWEIDALFKSHWRTVMSFPYREHAEQELRHLRTDEYRLPLRLLCVTETREATP